MVRIKMGLWGWEVSRRLRRERGKSGIKVRKGFSELENNA